MDAKVREATPGDAGRFEALARAAGDDWGIASAGEWRFLLEEAARGEGGGAVLAEVEGEAVAAAAGTMRGDLWRLGFIGARTDHPGLMPQVLEAVLAFPRNRPGRVPLAACPRAADVRLLGRLAAEGIPARLPIFHLRGTPPAEVPLERGLTPERVRVDKQAIERFLFWDNAVLAARARDHAFLANEADVEAWVYRKGDRAVGYAYVHASGKVGPAACADVELFPDLIHHSFLEAARSSGGPVEALLPGSGVPGAHALLGEPGLEIVDTLVLCTLRYSGAWDVALPWNRAFL